MEKHIMGENGISYTLGEDSLYLSRPVPPGRDRVSDWKVWNVEKNLLERAAERAISGAGTCREVK